MGSAGYRFVSVCFIVLAGLFWPVDAWLDSVYFDVGQTFLESLYEPHVEDIWYRIVIILLLAGLAHISLQASRHHPDNQSKPEPARNNFRVSALREQRYIEEQSQLRKMAYRDYLTGLYNRRRIEELLQAIHRTEQLRQGGMAVLFCDIDHFKQINTRHGHPAGDEVLKKLADLFRQHFRRGDAVGRWGGEEFLVVLGNVNRSEAETIAENFRALVAAERFPYANNLTISIGLAVLRAGESPDNLVKRADQALRQAKSDGRNRLHVCDSEG